MDDKGSTAPLDQIVSRRAQLFAHLGPELDDYLQKETQRWHYGAGEGLRLQEYLGMTEPEYQVYVLYPERLLAMLTDNNPGNGRA